MTTNRRTLYLSVSIAAFTLGLLIVGLLQWLTYRATLATTRETERAYVVLSHQTRLWGDEVNPTLKRALDIRGDTHSGRQHKVWFTVEVQNHGRTPAEVIGGGMWIRTSPEAYPPVTPTLEPPARYAVNIAPAFIVPNSGWAFTASIQCPLEVMTRIMEGTERLWLMGQVDYRDRFNNEHRAGYGRWYDSNSKQLVAHVTTRGMNYDKPLTAADKQQREQAESYP